MLRNHLLRRYRSMMRGESTAIVLFLFLLFINAVADGDWQNWVIRCYSMVVVCAILVQGALWWRTKLRLLQQNQARVPATQVARFLQWRTINWLLLALFPVVVLIAWLAFQHQWPHPDLWIGTLLFVLALLEQINYYYRQLMYDNLNDVRYLLRNKRLKQGIIVREVRHGSGEPDIPPPRTVT